MFPFIVGCPRSGTTLLRLMLDSHPELSIPGESHFIVPMLNRRNDFESTSGFDCDGFLESILANKRFLRWRLPRESVTESFALHPPASLEDAIRRLFQVFADSSGKSRYGDKTPAYVLSIDVLAHHFPEARFIHIVRDGRDVALSLVETEWGPSTLPQAAEFWQERVLKAHRDGEELGSARFMELRYEALVENPGDTLHDVCRFLDLEFSPDMLLYTMRAADVRASSMYPSRHLNISREPTPGLRDWRTTLTQQEANTFWNIAGPTLTMFDYSYVK